MTLKTPASDELVARALLSMPGGASAAARLHPAPGRAILTAQGSGAWVTDVDGREYIDLETSFGAMLLVRADRFVEGLRGRFCDVGLPVRFQQYGARFSLLFDIKAEPLNYRDVAAADRETELEFYGRALAEGIYIARGWHHGISSAHADEILDEALAQLGRAAEGTVAGRP